MRSNRSGQAPENTPVEALANAGDTAAESTTVDERAAEQDTGSTKRGPRPSIDLGEIRVQASKRTDFSTRVTAGDNPVYKAVAEATFGGAVDLVIKAESAEAVKRKIRVAGQKFSKQRVESGGKPVKTSIAGDTPQATDENDQPIEGYVFVTFKTTERTAAEVAAEPEAVVSE